MKTVLYGFSELDSECSYEIERRIYSHTAKLEITEDNNAFVCIEGWWFLTYRQAKAFGVATFAHQLKCWQGAIKGLKRQRKKELFN